MFLSTFIIFFCFLFFHFTSEVIYLWSSSFNVLFLSLFFCLNIYDYKQLVCHQTKISEKSDKLLIWKQISKANKIWKKNFFLCLYGCCLVFVVVLVILLAIFIKYWHNWERERETERERERVNVTYYSHFIYKHFTWAWLHLTEPSIC